MGYRYPVSQLPDDNTDPILPRELRGQPGSRAPYVALADHGGPGSTLDLYGCGFVLLTGPQGGTWEAATSQLPLPVSAYALDADGAARHGLEAGSAVLVRPDGFVAWRTASSVADPSTVLRHALDDALERQPDVAGARQGLSP
jgi:putative polyketide hydroxylase